MFACFQLSQRVYRKKDQICFTVAQENEELVHHHYFHVIKSVFTKSITMLTVPLKLLFGAARPYWDKEP